MLYSLSLVILVASSNGRNGGHPTATAIDKGSEGNAALRQSGRQRHLDLRQCVLQGDVPGESRVRGQVPEQTSLQSLAIYRPLPGANERSTLGPETGTCEARPHGI